MFLKKYKIDARVLAHNYLHSVHAIDTNTRKHLATVTVLYEPGASIYHLHALTPDQEFTLSDYKYEKLIKKADSILKMDEMRQRPDCYIFHHDLIDVISEI